MSPGSEQNDNVSGVTPYINLRTLTAEKLASYRPNLQYIMECARKKEHEAGLARGMSQQEVERAYGPRLWSDDQIKRYDDPDCLQDLTAERLAILRPSFQLKYELSRIAEHRDELRRGMIQEEVERAYGRRVWSDDQISRYMGLSRDEKAELDRIHGKWLEATYGPDHWHSDLWRMAPTR